MHLLSGAIARLKLCFLWEEMLIEYANEPLEKTLSIPWRAAYMERWMLYNIVSQMWYAKGTILGLLIFWEGTIRRVFT